MRVTKEDQRLVRFRVPQKEWPFVHVGPVLAEQTWRPHTSFCSPPAS